MLVGTGGIVVVVHAVPIIIMGHAHGSPGATTVVVAIAVPTAQSHTVHEGHGAQPATNGSISMVSSQPLGEMLVMGGAADGVGREGRQAQEVVGGRHSMWQMGWASGVMVVVVVGLGQRRTWPWGWAATLWRGG